MIEAMNYSFKKYQPVSLRFWHWLNALVMIGLLATVLIRKTFLSWRTNSLVIQEKLRAAGTEITPDFAKEIAVTLRNPLWDWHIYLGYGLTALLFGRLLIAVFVENKASMKAASSGSLWKTMTEIRSLAGGQRTEAAHHVLVKSGYIIFYLASLFMVVTGLVLTFKTELGLSKDLASWIKEYHELAMWLFVGFTGLHVLGVVIAENRKDRGIISDMIHGGDVDERT